MAPQRHLIIVLRFEALIDALRAAALKRDAAEVIDGAEGMETPAAEPATMPTLVITCLDPDPPAAAAAADDGPGPARLAACRLPSPNTSVVDPDSGGW